ncbi:hypothetical protein JG687_00019404 [Phytophthora cactorum]|uniref:Uncharacterized protein n=1 Tax=Phytophthora cactorum TaxID=29920 RepID=A0A8T1TN24_9STRA|nr:hypothetical protein JG687_00019404 [Phytophthora cactorum]
MKVVTNKQISRRLAQLPNFALIQILKTTVARLHGLEMELNELELALDDDQKEIEGYSYEIDEPAKPRIPNAASVLADMVEEREENAIKK